MKHPDKKQLIDIALNSRQMIDLKTAAHIKECSECKATVESLKKIMQSSDNSGIAPSERIKNGLLSGIDGTAKNRHRSGVKKPLLGAAVAAAAVIVIAFSAILIFHRNTALNIAMTLAPDHGEISYNKTLLKNPAEIRPGNITTGNISAATLKLGQAISVKIADDSDMTLISVHEYPDKDNNKYALSLELKKGIILLSANHSLMKKYTVSTQHAVFEPVGTEFLLSSDENSSRLSVTEGIVRVIAQNKNEIVLNRGEGCEVNAGEIKKFTIEPENAIESFNKKFARIKTGEIPASAGKERQDGKEKIKNNNTVPEANDTSVKNEENSQGRENNGQPGLNKPENNRKEFSKERSEIQNDMKDTKKGLRKSMRAGKGRN